MRRRARCRPGNLTGASNIVDAHKIQGLPLILRDPDQLILLSPGAMQSNTAMGGFSVNGLDEAMARTNSANSPERAPLRCDHRRGILRRRLRATFVLPGHDS